MERVIITPYSDEVGFIERSFKEMSLAKQDFIFDNVEKYKDLFVDVITADGYRWSYTYEDGKNIRFTIVEG